MTTRASGAFDVTLKPVAEDKTEGVTLARMSIDKQFHGDLDATSKGEMLSAVGLEGKHSYDFDYTLTNTD